MGKKDRRVDAYIAKSAAFAKPILNRLRTLVHAGCPDVEETIKIPNDLTSALKRSKKAQTAFENLAYSHKMEHVEWIMEAKRDETRAKRIETTVQWLAEGKPRHGLSNVGVPTD